MYKWFGFFIFFGLMYLIFNIMFIWIGVFFFDKLDGFFGGMFSKGVDFFLNVVGVVLFIYDLIVDGIIVGVGGVLVFVL